METNRNKKEERGFNRKEYMKEYHQKNKERLSENRRNYYNKNKEKEHQTRKKYYQKNKKRINENNTEYNRKYRLRKKIEKESQQNDRLSQGDPFITFSGPLFDFFTPF
ncbi:unnamed protein product [Meloidogyne enterolobii]|uniref:Uncharacterized protein n=1 Tax=Meloidogyne enterolobii TaxID=390850 RepID=A0ACB0YEQ8_MELEN